MQKDKSVYDQNDYYQDDGEASRLTWLLNGPIRLVDKLKAKHIMASYGKKSGHALDVGAGDGKFLYYLQQAGMSVHGTSASAVSCAACKKRYNIELSHTTELPALTSDDNSLSYDLVSYWHVFEHLGAPKAHYQKWTSLLSRDGVLIIEVPNPESLGARLHKECWLGSDPLHHINMCSESELNSIITDSGLEVVTKQYFSLKFSYVFLWSGLLGYLFNRNWDFDQSFDLIKSPLASLKRSPLRTLNGWLSIFYLSPIITLALCYEATYGRGEVLRFICKKA